MEFKDVVVKENPGLCRCCLSEGCYKDLGTEYIWMNETEIYADMLLECFDISISQHMEGPNGPNRLICEVCITRLRDACNFKKQVFECEKKFIDMVARGEFRPKMVVCPPVMKKEVIVEAPTEDCEVEYLEEDMDFDDDDDEPLKRADEAMPAASGSEEITVSPLKVKGKRGRGKKAASSERPEKKAKLDKPKTSKTAAKGGNEEPDLETFSTIKNSNTKQNAFAMLQKLNVDIERSSTIQDKNFKKNVLTVLHNSSVVPYRWHAEHFICIMCNQDFLKIEALIDHMKEHDKTTIPSVIYYMKQDHKINIEVSEMSCTICDTKFDQLTELTNHLKSVHDKFFDTEYDDCLIPYKLRNDAIRCGVCDKTFDYYRKLLHHMNDHYGKHKCYLCDKLFLSKSRLRCHVARHRSGLHCSDCSKTFETNAQWMQHEETVHNRRKLLKCLHCDETFKTAHGRKRHHRLIHNVKMMMHSCPVCEKEFHHKSKMEWHYRSVHEKQRTFPCPWCGKKFFSRTEAKRHANRHESGGSVQKRDLCKGASVAVMNDPSHHS